MYEKLLKYFNLNNESYQKCPEKLLCQIEENYKLKISHLCCSEFKKKPSKKWMKENGKSITITGMRKEEGGARNNLNCILLDKNQKLKKFHPLSVVSESWEDWFIQEKKIKLCDLYYPPYNFKRTGCKGCPFNLELEKQLLILENLLPSERKQCELIWKPVYDEYRRLNYRLHDFLLFDE